jgi:hypothetical protein
MAWMPRAILVTVDLLEKARREGHHFDILAKPRKPEQLITVIRAASRHRS